MQIKLEVDGNVDEEQSSVSDDRMGRDHCDK